MKRLSSNLPMLVSLAKKNFSNGQVIDLRKGKKYLFWRQVNASYGRKRSELWLVERNGEDITLKLFGIREEDSFHGLNGHGEN